MAEKTGVIYGINGPVIYLKDAVGFKMAEMVYVGADRLVGEVISLANDICKSYRREGKFFDELLDEAVNEV